MPLGGCTTRDMKSHYCLTLTKMCTATLPSPLPPQMGGRTSPPSAAPTQGAQQKGQLSPPPSPTILPSSSTSTARSQTGFIQHSGPVTVNTKRSNSYSNSNFSAERASLVGSTPVLNYSCTIVHVVPPRQSNSWPSPRRQPPQPSVRTHLCSLTSVSHRGTPAPEEEHRITRS